MNASTLLMAAIGLLICVPGSCALKSEQPIKGYIATLPAESAAEREARHALVAARRAGPIVIVHRGASAFAPENTLEAYAAAIDYGADGCEIDPRRTADGVIVLFHDDMLENLTDGFGAVSQLTYYELLSLKRRSVYGTATRETRIPTLVSLLELARRRRMLLHLDLKEPGMAEEIARLLDDADMWDQIVALNMDNAGALLTNPKLRLFNYKAPGLYLDRSDVDMTATKAALEKPGQMIIVDDPRVAARVLGRPACQPAPIPANLRQNWPPRHSSGPSDRAEIATLTRGLNADSPSDVTKLLDRDEAGRADTDGDPSRQQERAKQIVTRAWAARQLARIAKKSPSLVRLLEYQMQHRSLHRDWRYQGLDGAIAVQSLAALRATESVPMMVQTLMRVDPQLARAADPEYPNDSTSALDWRIKGAIVQALGELRCDSSKQALAQCLKLDEDSAGKLGLPGYADLTRSLLKQTLSVDEIRDLLRNPRREIRGTAILECIDHPSKPRTEALKTLPWAQELPRAR